jgi:glycyl-tRNA synthetase (class II)
MLTQVATQSPKFSGLANRATLDISSHESGRGFTVAYREPKTSPYAVKSGISTKELKGGKKEAKKEVVQLLDSIGRPELYQVGRSRRCQASQSR